MVVKAMPTTGDARSSASALRRFWDSSVGKKAVMAVTGLIGIGFVLAHMVGNLQMFKGTGAPQAMHDYAVLLRKLGALLWVARAVLLLAVVLHAIAAYQLTMRARAARPRAYGVKKSKVSTLASRTMRVGGVVLLVFVVFHLGDLTAGWFNPAYQHLDPYNNMRASFGRWWVAIFYIVAMVFLGLHLVHGAWAWVRTLGAHQPSPRPLHRTVAVAVAVAAAVGLAVIPAAALLGWFTDDTPIVTDENPTARAADVTQPDATASAQVPNTTQGGR